LGWQERQRDAFRNLFDPAFWARSGAGDQDGYHTVIRENAVVLFMTGFISLVGRKGV